MNNTFNNYADCLQIGLTIKKIRTQLGISQTKLADGICDRTALIHLEKGKSKLPSIFLLIQICKKLSITLDDFFSISYSGTFNQLWFRKAEIDALMQTRKYEEAYEIAKVFIDSNLHPADKQYLLLVEGNYLYSKKLYQEAKDKYLEGLKLSCIDIIDEVYTLTEMRLVNGLIYSNYLIDGKLSTDETINYIKILNNSIYDYPISKDYRIILYLMLSSAHFYFALKMYDDTKIIINNAIEISTKYNCIDFLGSLWLLLAHIFEIFNDEEKAKEYYAKSNSYFKLFDENNMYNISMEHQKEVFANTDY